MAKRKLRRPGWKAWLAILTMLVVVGGAGTWLLAGGGQSTAAEPTTVKVTSGTVKQSVSASGTIEPAKTADLDFGVSGTVTKVYVAAGDTVAKGQAIAKVDDAALVAARTAAQASYAAAVTQHTDDIDADASAVQLAADQTAVLSAESDLESAKQDVRDAVLRSTIKGTVSSIDLAVGDVVSGSGSSSGTGSSSSSGSTGSSGTAGSSGSTGTSGTSGTSSTSTSSSSAVTVTSTNKYVVDATVSADEATQVKKGMQATITATGSTATIYGTVSSVGLVAQTSDSGAAVFPVTVSVTGTQKDLYAGTSATASIVVKQVDNVVSVSTRAIRTSGSTSYVLKVVDGKAVKTTVKVGTVYGPTTQILSGLAAGDTVQVPGVTTSGGQGGSAGTSGSSGGTGGGPSGAGGSFGGAPGGAPGGAQ